jgi:flagellar hook-length control protein FliK
MIFNDVAAAKQPEPAVRQRQGRIESVPRGSFLRTLQEQAQRQKQLKPRLSEPGPKNPGAKTDDAPVSPVNQASGSSQSTETMTTDVVATSKVQPESDPAGPTEPELAEDVAQMLASSPLEIELNSSVAEGQAHADLAANLASQPSTVLNNTVTAGHTNPELASALSMSTELAEESMTGSIPVSIDDKNTRSLTEGLVAKQSQQGSTSTIMTNQETSNTTAAKFVANSDAQSTAQQEKSRPPELLSSVISKALEPQKSGETQAKADQQSAKELAEFELRKLTGQKATVIQPTSSGENKQAGGEPRADQAFPVARAEGTPIKYAEFNSQVLSKADAPSTAVDHQDVLNQIVRKAELMFKLNSSQMKIELHPEFLGKLTIKVMVEEGAVTARFITDNHQVKQMLEANLGMLRQTLESQGMKVERAEVDVQLNQGGLFDGSEGQQGWNWDHHFPPRTTGASLGDDSTYDAAAFLREDLAQVEHYGIQANGSLNFLI